MARPMREPAPVVTAHAAVCRDRFDPQGQGRHVPHELTGLMVLPTKRLAQIARCTVESADNTQLARVRSAAPWPADAVHRRRIRVMRPQTTPHRRRRRESLLARDATLCEHGGRLLDSGARPDHQRDGPSPLAHQPVPNLEVRGAVRFPVGVRLSRRSAERPPWEASVAQPVPDVPRPTAKHARQRRQQPVDPVWLQAPACQARPEPCRTHIALAIARVEAAIRHPVPWGVMVVEAWDVAADVVQGLARRRQDWIRRLHTHRGLATARVQRRAANGWTLQRSGPPSAVEDRVPRIPTTASRPVPVGEHTSGGGTRRGRMPPRGPVRSVVRCARASLPGRRGVLVTNRVDGDAANLIRLARPRWPPDTCAQDRKGPLGCNEDRRRSAEAMGQHGGLVVVAASRRHVTCLPAGPDRTRGLLHTRGDAWRQQGRAVRQNRWGLAQDPWSHGATLDQLCGPIFATQRGLVLG